MRRDALLVEHHDMAGSLDRLAFRADTARCDGGRLVTGLDIEGVLADKILRHHVASEANVPRDVLDRVLDALTPHVAAVLREQIETELDEARQQGRDEELGQRLAFGFGRGTLTKYAQAEAWSEGYRHGVDDMTGTETLTVVRRNPYRAAQVAPDGPSPSDGGQDCEEGS